MTVPREYTVNDFAINDTFAQATPAQGAVGNSGGNMLLQGATLRTSTAFGRAATVKAGEDIRPALESLRSAGGGTLVLLAGVHRATYNIVVSSKINIVGEGIDQTIIDFGGGAYSIENIAGSENLSLSNFTVRDSSTYGIEGAFDFVDRVRVTDCNIGFRLSAISMIVTLCKADANTFAGFEIIGSNGTFSNCVSETNGGAGFDMNSSYSILLGCRAVDNVSHGFALDSGYIICVGCIATDNTASGFYLQTQSTLLIACIAIANQTGNNITEFSANSGVVVGSMLDSNQASSQGPGFKSIESSIAWGNMNGSFVSEKMVYHAINSSGGSRVEGEVVIYASAADGNAITTTTTVGDDKVVGVIQNSVSDGLYGTVQTIGFCNSLKVNGTTDIAVGDFLGTYSVAGIAAKAVAGDMAFAIALEAYTGNDSNGVIDALLITPRKL